MSNTADIYIHLERIANLVRAEARQIDANPSLQPVQIDILHYLSICNQHSDIPAAVTEYLGLTKGTVSQSLSILESKGYLVKVPDGTDKRVIHLVLTEKGQSLVDSSLPPESLKQGLQLMPPSQRDDLLAGLKKLLNSMQSARDFRPFGTCRTCGYLETEEEGQKCTLTNLSLREHELDQLCREHVIKPTTGKPI